MRITRTCRRCYLRRSREAVEHSARDRIFSEYLLRSCDRLFRRFLRLHIMQDDIGPPRREHVLIAALRPGGIEDEELRNRIAEQSQLAIGLAVWVFGPPWIVLYDRYHGGYSASQSGFQVLVQNLRLDQIFQEVLRDLDILCSFGDQAAETRDHGGNLFAVIALRQTHRGEIVVILLLLD